MKTSFSLNYLFYVIWMLLIIAGCKKATHIEMPEVSASAVTNITPVSALAGGTVVDDGGDQVASRGVCWSKNADPTLADSKSSNGSGTGTFTSPITGLTPGSTYFVRAYATNKAGTAYSSAISFTTSSVLPSVTTAVISSITANSAASGGNVTSDGGSPVTARGVCWGTSANPTTAGSTTNDLTGTGTYTSTITGLSPGTTYYVRAYATNVTGTAYGNEVSFVTAAVLPTITTAAASNITAAGATSGGNVVSDGGSAVTAKGVCWSTTANPTIAGSKTTDGTGAGTFLSSITGLNPGTTYYARAYATNITGTAYGSEVTFVTAAVLPTLTTAPATTITAAGAISGGNVISDGGSAVTTRGVCWSTSANPTTANSKTTESSGTGAFTSSLTGLIPGTTYFVRAYAVNSTGTAYGNEVTFVTAAVLPSISTAATTSVIATAATSGGNVTSDGGSAITARGVCWGISSSPTTAGNKTSESPGTGTFVSTITGLTPGTTYFARAYATNGTGTAYGNEVTFVTAAVLPTVTTTAASSITAATATSGGNVTSDGGSAVTARGVCWSTSANPTTSGNKTTNGSGTGPYSSSIAGLAPGTTYYVRAYATSIAGTAYGNEIIFVTSAVLPSVTTNGATSITASKATSGGNVTSDGGSAVTARGVCWSTASNPTLANSKTINGTGTGTFSISMAGLAPGTTYYVRAYATNSKGTAYGNEVSFVTEADLPAVTTTAASSITSTSANAGGNVISDGGSTVTARGVCWSTSANPTTANSKTTDGAGTGTFSSTISGLTAGTTYYVRAYATNRAGTAYGSQVTFVTSVALPSLTTTAATSITTSAATSGGNITSDGGGTVTARGVCWSTSANPTIADSKTADSQGLGSFTSSISGLTSGTTYYVRAYATNSQGTAYGNEISFNSQQLTDIDGNTYRTVSIGTQEWMAENLRVTKYRNGDALANAALNYNESNASLYGRYYKWPAIVDNRGVCPVGWHLPSNDDWNTLFNFLGGTNIAGGKLKEVGTVHWNSPNTGATDEYGFSAMPGGFLDIPGWNPPFNPPGPYGYYWSSTDYGVAPFNYNNSSTGLFRETKSVGFNVRCIKD